MPLEEIDLGSGYAYSWADWSPDRTIEANAERFADVPDIERSTLLLKCPHGRAGLHVDRPGVREVFGEPVWTIEQEEPLTLSPSIHRLDCGCHGFIREGRWVSA